MPLFGMESLIFDLSYFEKKQFQLKHNINWHSLTGYNLKLFWFQTRSKSFLKKSCEWLLKWVIYWIAPLLLNSNFNYLSIRVNNWYNNKLTYLNSLDLFYGNGGYGLKWILVIPLKYFLNYSWNSSNMMPARMIQICFKNVLGLIVYESTILKYFVMKIIKIVG